MGNKTISLKNKNSIIHLAFISFYTITERPLPNNPTVKKVLGHDKFYKKLACSLLNYLIEHCEVNKKRVK